MSSKNWPVLSLIENEEPLFNWPLVHNLANWPGMQNATSDLSVWEDENNVVVEAALPGINKNEVDVTFEKGMLTVRASSSEKEEDKKRKYYRKSNRSFLYRINIPGHIEENQEPTATLTNGVMRIEFKKRKKDQPKKIQVT